MNQLCGIPYRHAKGRQGSRGATSQQVVPRIRRHRPADPPPALPGRRICKDTKTHKDRWLAIDPVNCALIVSYPAEITSELAAVGAGLGDDAYLFSNDPVPEVDRRAAAYLARLTAGSATQSG
jgi:hypothetical protein